jgi:hypothetical protein
MRCQITSGTGTLLPCVLFWGAPLCNSHRGRAAYW